MTQCEFRLPRAVINGIRAVDTSCTDVSTSSEATKDFNVHEKNIAKLNHMLIIKQRLSFYRIK